jgi:hypothetical protein
MQRFADFADDPGILDGAKVRIDDVLNRELAITGYAVKTSKFSKNKSGKYLTLQFRLDDDKRVLFTGSDVLIDQMEKYGDRVPFTATIRKVDRFYTLS